MLNYCGPVRVQCWQATCMALKPQHKTGKMTTNDMKMGWICNNDEENHKYKSKTTATAFEIQTRGIPPPPHPKKVSLLLLLYWLTCFWSSCCLLFIGGPLGTRTGETFDVFENVVFPLWNIVGLALGSVGAYNKNICGRSASNITTRCLSLKKTQHTKCQLLKSQRSDHISLSTYLIRMIFMPQLPTPNHTIKPAIQEPLSVERTVIKVQK